LTIKDRRKKRRRKLKLRQAGWERTALLTWKISFLILIGFFKNILSLSLFHIFRLPSILSVRVRPFFKGLLLLSIL
jgi:hypothetical protein